MVLACSGVNLSGRGYNNMLIGDFRRVTAANSHLAFFTEVGIRHIRLINTHAHTVLPHFASVTFNLNSNTRL